MQQSKKVRYIIVLFLLGVSVVALVGWEYLCWNRQNPVNRYFCIHPGRKN